LKEKYVASMILGGVGDALGYNNGHWEFCRSGPTIHKELKELGGLAKLSVHGRRLSDDTIMHIATAEALLSPVESREDLYHALAKHYVLCFGDMVGRAAGATTASSIRELKPGQKNGYCIRFDPAGGGCGAAMRAACIGLNFPREKELKDLIDVSIESGRMTHHHPTGYLGAVVAALFTAYAIQGKPVVEWGRTMIEILPGEVKRHITEVGRAVESNLSNMDYFFDKWTKYLQDRDILETNKNTPKFPEGYDVRKRDEFYKSVSWAGWGGASGHDAPLIAYDALLGADGNWDELLLRGMLHGGDSDSTGIIAGCWFGALYAFTNVNKLHYEELEYFNRLKKLGEKLHKKVWIDQIETTTMTPSPAITMTPASVTTPVENKELLIIEQADINKNNS